MTDSPFVKGWPRRKALATTGLILAGTAATAACGTASPGGKPTITDPRERSRTWAKRTLESLSLTDKIAQLFVPYVYGSSADTTEADDVAKNQEIHGVDNGAQLLDKHALGGIIYFGWSNNLDDPEQIAVLSNGLQDAALANSAALPLLISTDNEQGVVVRLGPPATQFPGNMALGATADSDHAETAAKIVGAELRAVGINQDFAPVADVNVNPANPVIGVRSFSSDPTLAADLTAAQVTGYQAGVDDAPGVAAAAKHFPGHGDTHEDSHVDLPIIEHSREEWQKLDAPPFTAAIDAGIEVIMTAHLVFPAFDESGDPATLSEPILTGLLRDELGFDGLVITDSLAMAGVRELYPDDVVPVRAIQAGVDMLLMPPDLDLAVNAVTAAVEAGDITEERIDASVQRILELKHVIGVIDDPHVDVGAVGDLVGIDDHLEAARVVSEASTTLVKNDDELLPLATSLGSVLVTGSGAGPTAALAEAIGELGPGTKVLETGSDPDSAAIDAAVAAAGEADVAIVITQVAANGPGQVALVNALREAGDTVVVAAKEPYDINQFPEAGTYLATYSYTEPAMAATARVLFGEANPVGKLPVMIPVADDPETELFAFGHGLGY